MNSLHWKKSANLSVGSVVITSLDLIESGIRPIQFIGVVVNGQAVGGLDLRRDDVLDMIARQV